MRTTALKAPFPWFGGKSTVASEVWARFGDTPNYVEPFFGSGAVLLGRPNPGKIETVNDADGMLVNLWRSIQHSPEETAFHADWPVSELDMTARHAWLVGKREPLTAQLEVDPDFHDPKIAGWWVWGLCCWIGSGWCSGEGPWIVVDGELTNKKLPHLGNAGMGINKQLPHLGNAGRGIAEWFSSLSDRLRRVRVACGDWSRVLGDSVTWRHGVTAVFLDPPYDTGDMSYATHSRVASDVRDWCVDAGRHPKMRIALCGYSGDHDALMSHGWSVHEWKARGGYSSQDGENENASAERIWFSPHCLGAKQGTLFYMGGV